VDHHNFIDHNLHKKVNEMVLDACFSSTGVVIGIVNGLADLTGNLFSAMLLIVILLIVLTMVFMMPLEVSAILVLPFLTVCYACVPSFASVTGVVFIYLGIIVAKNFPIK
jgi:hypothetical protein